MEPMKPELVNRLLHERPNLTRADIEEYHRLQAERKELYAKIYG